MEKISNYQLITLTVLAQLGTSIIFGFGATAGRDAWIAALISTGIGMLLVLVYTALARMQPGLTLIEWYITQFGKWIGVPIAWMYVLLIVYDAGRIIADLKYLIPMTVLYKTPPIVTIGIFVAVAAYAIFGGIEVIGRIGELFLPLILLLYFLEIILIFSSGIVHINYLRPIVGEGWKRILDTVWPLGISQTFAETLRFSMIWVLVDKPEKIMKSTLIATGISGVFIAFFSMLAVLGLGENTFVHSILPLYKLIQQISVADFVENLDIIEILYFLVTSFFKLSVELFIIVRGIQQLTGSENNRVLIQPIAMIMMCIGMTMATNISEHLDAGLKVLPYSLWVPLYIILPCILLIIVLIRKKLWKKIYIK